MAASDWYDVVQKAYIAYYGRPADVAGLEYWADALDKAGGSLNAIIDAFAGEPESIALYGSASVAERVTKIYQQIFARDPDTDGLNWWVSAVESGAKTLAALSLEVLNGAQGADANVIAVRLDAAKQFSAQLASGYDYSGDEAAVLARNWLKSITDNTTLQQWIAELTATLNSIDAASGNSGGGGGGNTSIDAASLFAGYAGLENLAAANTYTGILATDSLRSKVIQGLGDGGEAKYVSVLGDATAESTLYGTLIRFYKNLDMTEILQLDNFVTQNQAALASGNEAVFKQYIDLYIASVQSPTATPLYTDSVIESIIVPSAAAIVSAASGDPDFKVFDAFFGALVA